MQKPDCDCKGITACTVADLYMCLCNINAVVYIGILKRHIQQSKQLLFPEVCDYFSRKTSDLILYDLQQHDFIESACA